MSASTEKYGAPRNEPFCGGSYAKTGFRAFGGATRVDGGERAG